MSTASIKSSTPERAYGQLVRRTIEACDVAKEAAAAAADTPAMLVPVISQNGPVEG